MKTEFSFCKGKEKSFSRTVFLAGSDPEKRVVFKQKITAEKNGRFLCRQEYKIPKDFPSLPRVGVMAEFLPEYEFVTWFGKGPWENYSDRSASAQMGKYSSTVTEMYEDTYIVPQENGNRSGVKYMLFQSEDHGIKIASGIPFEFSSSHFSDQKLLMARHQSELKKENTSFLYLDLAQRGLGTGSCGPQTLPEYCLDEKKYIFTFTLEEI